MQKVLNNVNLTLIEHLRYLLISILVRMNVCMLWKLLLSSYVMSSRHRHRLHWRRHFSHSSVRLQHSIHRCQLKLLSSHFTILYSTCVERTQKISSSMARCTALSSCIHVGLCMAEFKCISYTRRLMRTRRSSTQQHFTGFQARCIYMHSAY